MNFKQALKSTSPNLWVRNGKESPWFFLEQSQVFDCVNTMYGGDESVKESLEFQEAPFPGTVDSMEVETPRKGLYKKYNVTRTDGKLVKGHFVIEFKDPNAAAALIPYCNNIQGSNPDLARELFNALGKEQDTLGMIQV